MGYIEIHNADGLGGWVNFDDIPFIEIINCQLCNEPTEARDIVANIVIKEEKPVVGAWQCRKCHAVNGQPTQETQGFPHRASSCRVPIDLVATCLCGKGQWQRFAQCTF